MFGPEPPLIRTSFIHLGYIRKSTYWSIVTLEALDFFLYIGAASANFKSCGNKDCSKQSFIFL